jgi:hypothetical protein
MLRIRFSDAGEIMNGRLDMTATYAMHNALRRELEHIAKITARADDDPRRILASAAGWEMFKRPCTSTAPTRERSDGGVSSNEESQSSSFTGRGCPISERWVRRAE